MTIQPTLEQPHPAGELHFADEVAETAVIRRDVGEQTVVMRPFLAVAPVSPLPRYDTGEYELPPREGLVLPETVRFDAPGQPRPPQPLPPPPDDHYPPIEPEPSPGPYPPPPPVAPSWNAPAVEYPVLQRRSVPYQRPDDWVRTVRRAAPRQTPLWALLLAGLGAGMVGSAIVWALAWAVTQ